VITSIAGHNVASSGDVLTALLTQTPGSTVQVTWVDAAGAEQTATVTLANGPAL
jgi:S1-C subfamily serine protease